MYKIKESIHEQKEREALEKRKKREQEFGVGALWIIWYYLDDRLTIFANKMIPDGKESKAAILGYLLMFGDIITTHTFLYFDLGKEGNYLPAKFYGAGLTKEFEFMKILSITFIVAFNYVSATRGWTKSERAGGKIGLFMMYFLFGMVVVWNIVMMVISLVLG